VRVSFIGLHTLTNFQCVSHADQRAQRNYAAQHLWRPRVLPEPVRSLCRLFDFLLLWIFSLCIRLDSGVAFALSAGRNCSIAVCVLDSACASSLMLAVPGIN
jgi:hypothetical protein